MKATEAIKDMRHLHFTACMNQRYHQRLSARWGIADKSVRILVGVLSVICLLFTVASRSDSIWEILAGFVAVVIALALNVVPTGERELHHNNLFTQWTDLRE